MTSLDAIAADPRLLPYWGWHDSHRGTERTAAYRPAMQQSRAEFHAFWDVCLERGLHRGGGLQLGLGRPGGTHLALEVFLRDVISVDADSMVGSEFLCRFPHASVIDGATGSPTTRGAAAAHAPYDLLFIDAGHRYDDVRGDLRDYVPLVRDGGLIALHDAVKRPTYEEEIEVWRVVADLKAAGVDIRVIGDEIGIAWFMKTEATCSAIA